MKSSCDFINSLKIGDKIEVTNRMSNWPGDTFIVDIEYNSDQTINYVTVKDGQQFDNSGKATTPPMANFISHILKTQQQTY